jgi:hypothetical protein
MDHGEILTRAWKIIWRYKILWIFGIFAGCAQGGGGGGGGSGWQNNIKPNSSSPDGGFNLPPAFQDLAKFFQEPNSWIWIVLIVLAVIFFILILTLVGLFLGTIGRIGLVRGTLQADNNLDMAEPEKITFSGLFRSSLKYFWRVFLLNLLLGIGWFVAIVAFAVLLVLSILGICLLIPYCCLLIPLGWLFQVYTEQTNLALILEDLSIGEALKRGWEMTRQNLGDLIVMGLILVVGGLIVGLALFFPMIILFIPLGVGLVLGGDTATITGVIVSLVLLVLYIPVLIFISGVLQAYIQSAWTLTYLALKKKAGKAPVGILPGEVSNPEIPVQ